MGFILIVMIIICSLHVEGGDYILVNRGKEGGNRDYASYSCNKLLFVICY